MASTTFADLIKRHGREIAFLGSVHEDDATPSDPSTWTDKDFVGLVGSAVENLNLFRMEDWADDLDSALSYLTDALEADDQAEQSVLLRRADKHMKDSYDIASELACNIGINFP